jgi:renalase
VDAPLVIVVGAGVSGLACAGELRRRGLPAVVLERAGRVGGRCTTRVLPDGQPVDHGVPFFHMRSHEFGVALNALGEEGKLHGWPVDVTGRRLACQRAAFEPGTKRWARREGVESFPRHLARDLDVRLGARVMALEDGGRHVAAVLGDGTRLAAPFVVVTLPVTEATALVAPLVEDWPGVGDRLARLAAIDMVSTAAVIAGYTNPAFDALFDLWYPLETTMLHMIAHDSGKRPRPRTEVLVLHGRPRFSSEALERAPEQWSADLLWEAGELMGPWIARPEWTRTHMWRFSRVRARDRFDDPVAFESGRGGRVALIGEAFASAGGLEGAYLSGIQVAEQIAGVA